MKREGFNHHKTLAIGLLLSAVFLIPVRGEAAEVCCACKPAADDLNTTCLLMEDAQLGSSTDCAALPDKADLDGWTCERAPLHVTSANDATHDSSRCKTVSSGGVCLNRPMNASDAKNVRQGETVVSAPSGDTEERPIPFQLNVPIPGFSANAVTPSLFADYLVTLIRYGISIVAVVTTIMFIYGAFLYLIGSSLPSIANGKTVMKDAIVGLILVISSTLILRTLNPNLLILNLVSPEGIDTSFYDVAAAPVKGTGAAGAPPEGVVAAIIEGAKKAKVDPCILLAICEHETGLRPLWNGQLAGTAKEDAIAFGTCQVDVRFLHDKNRTVQRARELYPDFPPESDKAKKFITDTEEKVRRGEWMLSNIEGSAFIAGSVLRSNIALNGGNELIAVASYGAGSGSLSRWRKANNCTYERGVTIKGATGDALKSSCIPHSVGIVIGNNASSGCREDAYNCRNPKPNAKAELIGTCAPTGAQCYAMLTDQFVQYVIKAYPRMEQAYHCGG